MKLNSADELWDAIGSGTETSVDTWRWGTVHTSVFERGGKHWEVTYFQQPEAGVCDVNRFPIEAVEVEPYQDTVTRYRKKLSPAETAELKSDFHERNPF